MIFEFWRDLNKLRTDFDEILWVDSRGGAWTSWLRFEPDADEYESLDPGSGHVIKIASRIALKVMDGFQ